MIWFFITILIYFIFALAAILDKYILRENALKPKSYAFYDSIGGILFIFLIFLPQFKIGPNLILIALLVGILKVSAIFVFYTAINNFEPSRVLPAIGGFLPCFTFFFSLALAQNHLENLNFVRIISLFLLISGSFLINFERKKINLNALGLSFFSAFLFSLYFVFAKFLYLNAKFLNSLLWILFFSGLFSLIFLFSKEVRLELKKERKILNKETAFTFILDKSLSMIGGFLQHLAISLVPISLLAFINALEGIKYVFILILSLFFSKNFPTIFLEKKGKSILCFKILSIFLIFAGMFIFYYL